MLEGLFQQIGQHIPVAVPRSVPWDAQEKSMREPLPPRERKPFLWVPPVHSKKDQTQNTKPLSDQDKQILLDYLTAIGETDPAIIEEVLEVCARNAEKRSWLLQWADNLLQPPKVNVDTWDDRRYCRDCHWIRQLKCLKHDFRPVDDVPRRCGDFKNKP